MVYDTSDPEMYEAAFNRKDWNSSDFRNFQGKELPGNMAQSCDLGFVMREKVDANIAVDNT